MDKKILDEYGINEAVSRLRQINEYTFITRPSLSEDGEDDADGQQPSQQSPQDNGGQNANMQPSQQGGMGMNGDNQPNPQSAQDSQDNSMSLPQQPMGGMGNEPSGGDIQQPQIDDGQSLDFDVPNGGEGVETTEMEPDDEVIDVDDLTQSQEETETKVDGVNQKLARLLNVVTNFTTAIRQNDQKIEDLKKEFEKRNPTPEERLNLRSQSNYPYSEIPKDYWDKKTAENPNYNVKYDNDVSPSDEQKIFNIHQSDVDGNLNYQSIADSFDKPYKLTDFLNF